jgi:hypothetical protein
MQDQAKASRDRLIVECHELRARVDYLESVIKLGGAAYRAARIGLGAPAVELDDYIGMKERAEKAERERDELRDRVHNDARNASRSANDLIKDAEAMRKRAEQAEAHVVELQSIAAAEQEGVLELRKRFGARDEESFGEFVERLASRAEDAERLSEALRAELRRVVGELDRVRAEPHLIEAGQTKYDAAVWRARCRDAEAELERIRAERDAWSEEAGRREMRAAKSVEVSRAINEVALLITQAEAENLRAKVTRQRRELRRLNRDGALLRGSKAEKPAAKTEEKPADDRVVRVGDVWSNYGKDWTVKRIFESNSRVWAIDGTGEHFLALNGQGEPLFDGWTLVSRRAER